MLVYHYHVRIKYTESVKEFSGFTNLFSVPKPHDYENVLADIGKIYNATPENTLLLSFSYLGQTI